MASYISDEKLRQKLKLHGIDPGPITDTTRHLYISKLQALERKGNKSESKSNYEHEEEVEGTAGVVNNIPPNLHITQCMWLQLNDPSHIASDTLIMFADGELFHVSRAVITSVCRHLDNMFYNLEEPYHINIISGDTIHTVWVRGNESTLDLKEKISMEHCLAINQIQLIYNQGELINNVTLGNQGVTAGANVNLSLTGQPTTPSPYPVICNIRPLNHYFSISHLRLGMGMNNVFPQPKENPLITTVALKSHVQHLIHVYDIPNVALKIFIGFLYCGEMPNIPSQGNISLILTCCVALGEAFKVPHFTHHSFYHLKKHLLKLEDTEERELVMQYAESMGLLTTFNNLSVTN